MRATTHNLSVSLPLGASKFGGGDGMKSVWQTSCLVQLRSRASIMSQSFAPKSLAFECNVDMDRAQAHS